MGVEVVGFEMVEGPVDSVSLADNSVSKSKENGDLDQLPEENAPIKFGSHEDEPVKEQPDVSSASNVPKDAADEWPAPKQIHTFYFIRYRPYEDPNIKAKIDLADKEIQKRSQARFQITETLKGKRVRKMIQYYNKLELEIDMAVYFSYILKHNLIKKLSLISLLSTVSAFKRRRLRCLEVSILCSMYDSKLERFLISRAIYIYVCMYMIMG